MTKGCGHIAADLAVHDDLAAHIAARLEQDITMQI